MHLNGGVHDAVRTRRLSRPEKNSLLAVAFLEKSLNLSAESMPAATIPLMTFLRATASAASRFDLHPFADECPDREGHKGSAEARRRPERLAARAGQVAPNT
jgi:hypothetical protein